MASSRIARSLTSTLRLNDGVVMPMFGLGTGPGSMEAEKDLVAYHEKNRDNPKAAVLHALRNGYRLVDSAQMYMTEAMVGEALKESGVKREDVFVVSKLGMDSRGKEATTAAVRNSLNKLDMEYVDLYLIHSPHNGKIVETYDSLLDMKRQGLIKSVGVSNFNIHHLEGLIKAGRPLPSVNQIELHPFQRFEEVVKFCQERDITLMGYSPIARGLECEHPLIKELSKKYSKTSAQVMIRWSVQKGYITIPKSLRLERIIENCQVFDWELSQGDMDLLDTMPRHGVTWDAISLPWID